MGLTIMAHSPTVRLRQWRDEDLPLYAEMNADPAVMEFFPHPYTYAETEASFVRQRSKIDKEGWGLWAVEVGGTFAGFTGLAIPSFEASFMPCVEIGWRLRKEFWGTGTALAAAQMAESYAFTVLKLDHLVSFTAKSNVRSWRLMEKLSFSRVPEGDFFHPKIARENPLCLHVLYTKSNKTPGPTIS